MKKWKIILIIVSLFYQAFPQQGDGQYGVRSIFDDSFGIGVASVAMGGAYVSIADNPSAVYWNPSGLDFINQMNLMLFHSSYYEGTLFDFVSFVYPTLNLGTIGLGYARVGVGDIPLYDDNGVNYGKTTFASEEIYLSYGKRIPFNLSVGTTFKVSRQSTDLNGNTAAGLGLDLGILWRTNLSESFLTGGWSVGFKLHNLIQPNLRLGSQVDTYPSEYRFGVSKLVPLGFSNALQISFDYYKNNFMDPEIRFGARFNFKNFSTLSVGMKNGFLTSGASLQYRFLRVDYAYGNDSYNGFLGAVHRIGLTIKLGLTREQMLQIAEKKRLERERELVEKTREEERMRFVQRHLEAGKKLFEEGKFLDAYVEFQQVLSEDPFNLTAKSMLDSSDKMLKQQFQLEQQKAIEQAIDKNREEETQRFVLERYERGRTLLDQKRYTEAIIEFNLALSRDPNNRIVQSALKTARDRIAVEVRRLVDRAREEYQKGNFAEALQLLNDATVIAPEDQTLRREITNLTNSIKVQQLVQEGLIYYDLGEYENALRSFEEALKLDPANEVIQRYISRSRTSTMIKAEKMDPESENEYVRGVELYLSGRYSEALEIWTKLREKYPYNKKVLDAIKSAEERIKRLSKQK